MSNNETEFRCLVQLQDGTPCSKTFKRKWNLQRHKRTQHASSPTAPANVIGFKPVVVCNNTPPGQNNPPPAAQSQVNIPRQQPAAPVAADATVDIVDRLMPHLVAAQSDLVRRIFNPAAVSSLSRGDDPDPAAKRRFLTRDMYVDEIPVYDIKESRKFPVQIKAHLWLLQDAKTAFDRYATTLLRSWGVTRQTGTCVLVPADWEALEPSTYFLDTTLSPETCAILDFKRLDFRLADHITSFGRSAAWFSSWPRSGVQLDNFIECGPYQRMDGSHLCHNGLCINPAHITYETAKSNHGRGECREWAKGRRLEEKHVPAGCAKHDPPCLLQQTVLTTYERCLVQLSVLREALGLEPADPPARPRRHPYSTLEYKLPLQFQETIVSHTLADTPLHTDCIQKPSLVCASCPRIISFATVTGLWSHIIHKHGEQAPGRKLEQVRDAGAKWSAYTTELQAAGPSKQDVTTLQRLEQLRDPDTTWHDVLCWKLR